MGYMFFDATMPCDTTPNGFMHGQPCQAEIATQQNTTSCLRLHAHTQNHRMPSMDVRRHQGRSGSTGQGMLALQNRSITWSS